MRFKKVRGLLKNTETSVVRKCAINVMEHFFLNSNLEHGITSYPTVRVTCAGETTSCGSTAGGSFSFSEEAN